MPRRDHAMLAAALCAALTVAAPAAAQDTGGTAPPRVLPKTTGGIGYGEPGTHALVVTPVAMVGRRVIARGTIPGAERRKIVLQRLDRRRGWRSVARGRVRSTERFLIRWKADRSGRIRLRVVTVRRLRRAAASSTVPTAAVNVYRPARATYYGPGLFGNRTACGQTLTPDLLGVAHRRLPCGTQVAIVYKRREIVVPVIDRGPFHDGYSWDLTQATADALDFHASGSIGYARVRAAPAS